MSSAAILVEPARFADAAPAVIEAVPDVRAFISLPILVASVDDSGLDEVAAVPGVVGVVTTRDDTFSVLEGLDRTARLCLGLDDEWTLGGVVPGEDYPYVFDEPTGISAPPAVCAAVNLSLTPEGDDATVETLPTDVVNHATRAVAALTLPVVAAGNHHKQGARYETVSPWAEPEWVLSVGATNDASGTVEWPRSARGSTASPDIGPDLLSWGQNPFDDPGFGTSFAAARVSRMAVLCRAWLEQVAANIERLAGRDFGVPLVGGAVVDRELKAMPGPPAGDYAALPVLATVSGALEFGRAEDLLGVVRGSGAVGLTRALLLNAAAAIQPAAEVPLSAPSLTMERLAVFLDGLSAARLVALAWPDGRDVSTVPEQPLFPRGTAERLELLVTNSQPAWGWDVDTHTAVVRRWREDVT